MQEPKRVLDVKDPFFGSLFGFHIADDATDKATRARAAARVRLAMATYRAACEWFLFTVG